MNAAPSLAPLIVEAERVLSAAIQYFGLQVRSEQIVVTIQRAGRMQAYGWFAAGRWQNGKPHALHEINLSAEHLKECDMGDLLLHELAHAENKQLNIQDCSGLRHNKAYKRMAERLGLIVEEPTERNGYGITRIGEIGADFLENIAFKRELFSLSRLGAVVVKEPPGSRLVKWECPDCGYTMRLTNKWLSKRAPSCPLCSDGRAATASPQIEDTTTKIILSDEEIAGAAEVQTIKIEKSNGRWRLHILDRQGEALCEDSCDDLRGSVELLWLWMKETNLLEAKR